MACVEAESGVLHWGGNSLNSHWADGKEAKLSASSRLHGKCVLAGILSMCALKKLHWYSVHYRILQLN